MASCRAPKSAPRRRAGELRPPRAVLGKLLGLERKEERGVPPSKQFWQPPPRLNATPMERWKREAFYADIASSVTSAVTSRAFSSSNALLEAVLEIPESNAAEGDVYRAGTLLECAREIAFSLCESAPQCANAPVRLCVQGAMKGDHASFAGVPMSLNGMRSMLDSMDISGFEGKVVTGGLGAEEIGEKDGVHVLLSPQNSENINAIIPLQQHCEACEQRGIPVVLLNPYLEDVPSPDNVMQVCYYKGCDDGNGMTGIFTTELSSVAQVEGRADRLSFIQRFECAYWFSLVYKRP